MSKSKTAFEITEEHQILFSTLEQADGLPPEQIDELMALLNINEAEFQSKAESYAHIIDQKLAEADRLKKRVKAIQDRIKVEENLADRLKSRILLAMQAQGWDKAQTDEWRFGLRKSEAVEVEIDPSELPEAYRRQKFEADKTAIKAALERGEDIPGVRLVQRQSLTIR